jgi:hypothetical protein
MTVDKKDFISILHRYSGSTAEEAEKLLSLTSEYPYSQLLHTLAARASKDHNLYNHQEALQLAAVHAADRTVLKEIITTQPFQPVKEDEQPASEIATPRTMEIAEVRTTLTIKSIDSIDVADEVIRDLEKLNTLRHNFEMLFVEYSEVSAGADPSPPEEPLVKPAVILKEEEKTEAVKPSLKSKKSTKSKKQRIIELAKAMHLTDGENEHTAASSDSKRAKKNTHQPDELIQEIQANKREITPESDKQKEQIELINQFIKAQPSITNAKDRQPTPAGDLNPIKSGEFGDNIVSETLVEILIKQGKKDKAIEVLKKLIWKYPQKKTYFASQIEDLKK